MVFSDWIWSALFFSGTLPHYQLVPCGLFHGLLPTVSQTTGFPVGGEFIVITSNLSVRHVDVKWNDMLSQQSLFRNLSHSSVIQKTLCHGFQFIQLIAVDCKCDDAMHLSMWIPMDAMFGHIQEHLNNHNYLSSVVYENCSWNLIFSAFSFILLRINCLQYDACYAGIHTDPRW